MLGIVLVAIGAMAGFGADRLIAHRQEVQENTRFVRQVVIDSAPDTEFNKPFRGLELRSAALARLQLGCDVTSTSPAQGARSCTARI